MSNAFDDAFDTTLGHEGGFADHPADHGGATNRGFSLAYLKSLGDEDRDGYLDGDLDHDSDVDVDDVRKITEPEARRLALREFWERYRCGEIEDRLVAAKFFDLIFNMRPGTAGLVLQRALRATLRPVTEDGVVGSQTIEAVNAADPRCVLIAMRSEAAAVYRMIAAADPTQRAFLAGWLSRAYS